MGGGDVRAAPAVRGHLAVPLAALLLATSLTGAAGAAGPAAAGATSRGLIDGQAASTPDGDTFVPFAEHAYRLVNSVAFESDGDTMYFALLLREVLEHRGAPDPEVPEVALFSSRRTDAGWSEPALLELSGAYHDYEPTLSGDGTLMIFNSRRPWADGRMPEENDLWMTRRNGDGWGPPRRIEEITSFEYEESYPTLAADGTLVFMSNRFRPGAGSGYDLWESRLVDGHFTAPALHPVSTQRWGEGDPWIAADGSYLIFTRWDDEVGWNESCDLYIAFRDGTDWSEPVALAELNRAGSPDFGAAVSPDGGWIHVRRGPGFLRVPAASLLQRYQPR